VVAIPDPLATRHLVQEARRQKPHLVIVARRHSEAEQRHLSTGGVDHAVLAE
jgi:CPA2 family monovalent cation:H+ antiporter-2